MEDIVPWLAWIVPWVVLTAGNVHPLSPRACCEQVATVGIKRGQLIINELSPLVDQLADQAVSQNGLVFCNALCNGNGKSPENTSILLT